MQQAKKRSEFRLYKFKAKANFIKEKRAMDIGSQLKVFGPRVILRKKPRPEIEQSDGGLYMAGKRYDQPDVGIVLSCDTHYVEGGVLRDFPYKPGDTVLIGAGAGAEFKVLGEKVWLCDLTNIMCSIPTEEEKTDAEN